MKSAIVITTAVLFASLAGGLRSYSQTAPDLQTAERFDILSGASITSTDSATVKGDIGAVDTVSEKVRTGGATFDNSACIVFKALNDLDSARDEASAEPSAPVSSELSDTTLTEGAYKIDSSATLSDTIRLSGDSNSVFILNVAGDLTFDTSAVIVLEGGVKAENVYFNSDGSTTLKEGSEVHGTLMCDGAITCEKEVTGETRLLSKSGVSVDEADTIGLQQPTAVSISDLTLGRAASFALLAHGGITSDDSILCAGNIGSFEGAVDSAIFATDTLFPPNSCEVQQAISDLTRAIKIASALTATPIPGALGGQSLAGGVYDISGSASLDGTLTLTGNDASCYIFKISGHLSVAAGAIMNIGSVPLNKVFWVVDSNAIINEDVVFSGIVLTKGNIASINNNEGRLALMSLQGSINVVNGDPGDPAYLFAPDKLLRDFTAYLCADGTVHFMGFFGSYPAPATDLTNIVAIGQGGQALIALTNSGAVYIKGGFPNPGPAVPVSNIKCAIKIAAGIGHYLALLADGTVMAFGGNTEGELGQGNTDFYPLTDGAVAVPGLSNIVSIACGRTFSLALDANGDVYSWGTNDYGQLAKGSIDPIPNSVNFSPVLNTYLSGIQEIACGRDHALAITNNNTAYAWGLGTKGQLGDGQGGTSGIPVQITDNSGNALTGIIDIGGGFEHSLALTTGGDVYGWGGNTWAQILCPKGNLFLHPVLLFNDPNVVDINALASQEHSWAIFSTGIVKLWGSNDYGQLGVGSILNNSCDNSLYNTSSCNSSSPVISEWPFATYQDYYYAGLWDGNPCTPPCKLVPSNVPSNMFDVTFAYVSPISCISNTGQANALPTGSSPFVYQWDVNAGSQSSQTATGLIPGSYQVSITDVDGCFSVATAEVGLSYDEPGGLIISSNTTISGVNRTYGDEIIVQSGSTLTIENSTLEFFSVDPSLSYRYGITVEPGARLIVKDSKFTSIAGCEAMWGGIQVKGLGLQQVSNPMLDNTNGFVWMRDGSIIENAHLGIQAGCAGISCNLADGGGRIRVTTGSRFVNNRQDVIIGNYPTHINRSVFENTEFLTTGPLIDIGTYHGMGTENHMKILGVSGIEMRGCVFQNSGSFAAAERGTGILGIDAGYTVKRTCDVMDNFGHCVGVRSRFDGLTYGVRVNNIDPWSVVEVQGCEFTDSQRGIYLGNSYGARLNRNIFDMPVSQTLFPYGIYLDGSTAYEVEENEFFTSDFNTLTIGIIANNSGSSGDELYRNEFHDPGIGIWAQGQSSFSSNQGLQIKCNDFVNDVNFFDILNITGDIGSPQGQCDFVNFDPTFPAGNTFSHTCNTVNGSNDAFANANTSFVYNHHNDNLRTPQCFSSMKINLNNCVTDYHSKQIACPSNFTITGNPCGFGPTPCDPVLAATKVKTTQLNAAFDSLVDGGNTPGLLATIATASVGQSKNGLMAVSPYVSDTALLAYLSKPINGKGSVPPGHVKQVVIANSPVTDPVKAASDARNLPPGIQAQIDSAQIGTSPRRELELEIAFFERQLSLNYNSLSRFFLYDSLTIDGIDSVIEILKLQDGINRELQLTEAYIEAERLTEAKLQLDTLDLIGGFDNFCKLQHIVIDIIEDSASFDTLLTDTLLKQTVDSIANDTLQHGYLQARAILSMVFGTRFSEHIEPLPQQVQLKTSGNSEGGAVEETSELILSEEIQELGQWVKVYPNPADKSVTIDYRLAANTNNAVICVYNIFGTKVYQQKITQERGSVQHNVSNLPEGIYLYTVTENQALLGKEKIMVIR